MGKYDQETIDRGGGGYGGEQQYGHTTAGELADDVLLDAEEYGIDPGFVPYNLLAQNPVAFKTVLQDMLVKDPDAMEIFKSEDFWNAIFPKLYEQYVREGRVPPG